MPAVSLSPSMSAFSDRIYRNKYAHDLPPVNGEGWRKESWLDTADRQARCVVQPYLPELTGPIRRLIGNRQFMPGGRYLYSAGRKYPQISNCLAGETKIVTRRGVFTLRELQGRKVEVLNRHGEWEAATVRSFGIQPLLRVRFTNGDEVYATEGHRWCQADGGMKTTLEIDRVPLTRSAEGLNRTNLYLQVESVEETDRVEEVFCCVVPGTESFTLSNGLSSGNCFLMDVEDSRESWAELMSNVTNGLMTGGGVGVVYSKLRPEGHHVGGMGGKSTGPCALMRMVNEAGRYIMQGGSRRSAIWAGLHWSHPDVFNFINLKNWSDDIRLCKRNDFSFPAPMDGTNISVILDTDFFAAYSDPGWRGRGCYGWQEVDHKWAYKVYWAVVRNMLETGEPGFSVDCGENEGKNLRNAPVHGDTHVLTATGYQRAADLADTLATVWTGKRWARNVVFRKTGDTVETVRVCMSGGREIVCDPSHPFLVEHYTGAGSQRRLVGTDRIPAGELQEGDIVQVSLPQPDAGPFDARAYTLGFLYGDGSFTSKSCAEVTICADDKRPCAELFAPTLKHTVTHDKRGYLRIYFATNPLFEQRSKEIVPELGTPESAASFLAGLFDADGNADTTQKRIRLASVRLGFLEGVRRLLESVGILAHVSKGGPSGYGGRACWQLVVASGSTRRFLEVVPTARVRFDIGDYRPYRTSHVKVVSVTPAAPADVYCADVKVEEHSFCAEGVIVSNCTEVDSDTNCDNCNLASLNMARFEDIDQFAEAVYYGTAFLLCGSLYGQLPVAKMREVREKNRRVGLGLMGVHEWLVTRGYRYEPNDELAQWLQVYTNSTQYAYAFCERLGISRPVATRSVAPTGTISIIAETTSGIEPIYAVAYKRRYLHGTNWMAQYVIDATGQRLIEAGADPDLIEDAYTLAEDVERRVRFQAFAQKYVDHGISSTINLPRWGSSINNEDTVESFGNRLLPLLPEVRGLTVYPDGSRGGQPLNRVPYEEALAKVGQEFSEGSQVVEVQETGGESCVGGFCNW